MPTAVILALAGCGPAPEAGRPTETGDTSAAGPFDPYAAGYVGDPARGAERFAPRCATCHGEEGRGGIGPDLAERVPRFSDIELYTIIVDGNGAGMPAIDVGIQEGVDLVAFLAEAFPSARTAE